MMCISFIEKIRSKLLSSWFTIVYAAVIALRDQYCLFNGQKVLSSNLDSSDISTPDFPSRMNFKLHHNLVTPKVVKEVTTDFGSSRASGSDCMPVVVL